MKPGVKTVQITLHATILIYKLKYFLIFQKKNCHSNSWDFQLLILHENSYCKTTDRLKASTVLIHIGETGYVVQIFTNFQISNSRDYNILLKKANRFIHSYIAFVLNMNNIKMN